MVDIDALLGDAAVETDAGGATERRSYDEQCASSLYKAVVTTSKHGEAKELLSAVRDLLQGSPVFPHSRRECIESYRPTIEFFQDRQQDAAISLGQSEAVDLQACQCTPGPVTCDHRLAAPSLGEFFGPS